MLHKCRFTVFGRTKHTRIDFEAVGCRQVEHVTQATIIYLSNYCLVRGRVRGQKPYKAFVPVELLLIDSMLVVLSPNNESSNAMKAKAIISDLSPFAFYLMNLKAIKTNHILIVPFLRDNWQLVGGLVCVLKSVKTPTPQHGLKINTEPHYHTRIADIVVLWKWNVQLL